MALRAAQPDDARSIASVHVSSWWQTYEDLLPEADLEALDVDERTRFWERALSRDEPALTIVAEPEGEIAGFASAGPARQGAKEGELYAVYVLEGYQDQGLGRKLFEAVLDHLRSHGLVPAGLWVLEENPAVGFYEHLGGKRVGQRETEHGLTEVRYRWRT